MAVLSFSRSIGRSSMLSFHSPLCLARFIIAIIVQPREFKITAICTEASDWRQLTAEIVHPVSLVVYLSQGLDNNCPNAEAGELTFPGPSGDDNLPRRYCLDLQTQALRAKSCRSVHAKKFIRRLIFSVGIGNNDMHLKNWSLIYRDGRTPRLAPAYDFVSTIRYIADDKLALSITKEKAADQVNLALLERFARKAQVPTKLVLDTARETADKMRALWPALQKELPLDGVTRLRVTAHMKSVPLLKE